jgi:WD40 repeat protein
MGIIAGGMTDGTVKFWNPAKLAAGDSECLFSTLAQHKGSVNGVQFNPNKESSHLLASGKHTNLINSAF